MIVNIFHKYLDTGKAAALKDRFKTQFTKGGTEPALEAFDGTQGLLIPHPNTRAAVSLNTNRATGPDGIQII